MNNITKPEIENHSTLKLMFGKCGAWQNLSGSYVEKENIFSCIGNSRKGNYDGGKFAQSQFWRTTTDRFWQYDDFTFEGIAAASYLINAHRFKIWFNPFECYKFLYSSIIYTPEKADKIHKSIENKSDEEIKDIQKQLDDEWKDIVSGKNSSLDDVLVKKYLFNRNLYIALENCVKNKTWDFKTWMMWSSTIISNPWMALNVESIMAHEMFHVIWNHLGRLEERDSVQWNLATDFAINQNLDFTEEIQKMCITRKNKSFFNRFILSTVKYLMNNDKEVSKSLKEDFKIDEKTEFSKIKDEKIIASLYSTYMTQDSGWNHTDKYSNKSADLYYRILLESCVIINNSGIGGYDKHGKWNDTGENSQEGCGEGETIEKDGKKYEKGAAEGTEKCEKGKDGDKPDFHSEHDKKRGKGGREEHKGFDPMEAAAARREVKSTVKDSLERCGVNPDDPDEIEKALKATPGMGILGALILEWFKVRKKNWKQILKKELTSYSNPQDIDYTMSRESRVIPDFFPGKKRERGLDVIIQVDTSVSINYKDWNDFINQIEEISRSCDTKKVRVMQVHSVIASDEMVNISRIKNMRIKEVGGTTMQLGPAKLKKEKNKKLLIIFSDGYVDIFSQKDYNFKVLWFLSRGNEHQAESLRERGFSVIVQDEE